MSKTSEHQGIDSKWNRPIDDPIVLFFPAIEFYNPFPIYRSMAWHGRGLRADEHFVLKCGMVAGGSCTEWRKIYIKDTSYGSAIGWWILPFPKMLQLSRLNLNKENPRFDPVESHALALKVMVESYGDELWNLAKDIAANGLNPSELPIVYMNEEGDLTVKDGNRRITALLAISKPNKIPSSNKAYVNRFKILKTQADLTRLRKVSCVVFEDEEEADRWVELKHTGKNAGVGTVPWDALMIERFRAHRTKQASPMLQAYNFVERHVDATFKQNLVDFPITNLDRLLSNPDFRKSLGLILENGILKYEIAKEEALRNLSKVVQDIATKKIRVDDIKTTEKMIEYATKLRSEGFLQVVPKIDVPKPVEEEKEQPETHVKPKKEPKKEKPPTAKRTTLIPKDCTINITEARVNNIYQELKTLNVNKFPNATSVLFRVFFELSLNRCIKEKEVENVTEDSKLINKIKRVHDHFIDNGIMNKEEMQGVMLLCNVSGNQSIPMTEQFNGYVHNSEFHPAPGDIKTLWDNLQQFIMKLWC